MTHSKHTHHNLAGLIPAALIPAILACGAVLAAPAALAQAPKATTTTPDLAKDPTLYVVGYSHLDTQWCWDYQKTINEYIPNTMRDNIALMEKYPHYTFNFSGANRYRMMKEYYPSDYQKVKQYIAAGRWFPAGSSWEESDVNAPSAEALIRQVLYGNKFFQREFGKTSQEYMLPDCFGFPASLPSILAHCGVTGFSTQKLTWGSANGIPFNVGVWEGPDGKSVMAAFNPGSYTGRVRENLSQSQQWWDRIQGNGTKLGLFTDYHYFGTGDQGGAPAEQSVQWVEKSVTEPGRLRVVSGPADQMFKDITAAQRQSLPRYKGDLLLTEHSAGSLTSEAYVKRWNRKSELLAQSAERASVAASWLGALGYPQQRLNDAWGLVLGAQFHDILPGTSLPKAYEYAWNDQVLALNQFAAVTESAVGAVSRGLDTRAKGASLVVYNPLAIRRQDPVEASVVFGKVPKFVRVFGPDGLEVPSQVISRTGSTVKVLFLADVPSVGFAAFDVRPATAPYPKPSALKVARGSLENARYKVTLDANGDVAQVFDKAAKRNLLSAPHRLAFLHENPREWPAWNMDWTDRQNPPTAYVSGPATVKVVENGPVRVAIEVSRQSEGSEFVQVVRLNAGAAGNRVEFANKVRWHSKESSLKASFPLSVSNPEATYNLDLGAVKRGNNEPKKYEVPSHQWFDLTSKDGSYGVSVLEDSKYGSDKPDDSTLRLTLLYTPGTRGGYGHQGSQDWGRHEFVYGLMGHKGDWRQGKTPWEAARLNSPLLAFQSPAHAGSLGKSFAMLRTSTEQVGVMALKKAEDDNRIILRVNEMTGQPASSVRVAFAAPIVSAEEVDGQERPIGKASVKNGALVTSLGGFQPRTFAVRLGSPQRPVAPALTRTVVLPFNTDVIASRPNPSDGNFDKKGCTLDAAMLPATLTTDGIPFRFGSSADGRKNAVACQGQKVALPKGQYNRVFVLAAAANGDTPATFQVDGKPHRLTVRDWSGYIGQWFNREWTGNVPAVTWGWEATLSGIKPAFIHRDEVAWFASHRLHADGASEPYVYSYLFRYEIPVQPGAKTLTLPNNDRIRVMAVTAAARANNDVRAAQPLYDVFDGKQPA